MARVMKGFMPRYFCKVTGRDADGDEDGIELLSPLHAKREGAKLLGALVADGFLDQHDSGLHLEVVDENHVVLHEFDLTGRDVPLTLEM